MGRLAGVEWLAVWLALSMGESALLIVHDVRLRSTASSLASSLTAGAGRALTSSERSRDAQTAPVCI